jgi:hypothetical protein
MIECGNIGSSGMKKKYIVVGVVAILLSNGFTRPASTGIMPVGAEQSELVGLTGSDTDEMSPEDEAQEQIFADLETEYESIIPTRVIDESNPGSEDLDLLDLAEYLSDVGSDSGLESTSEFGEDEDAKFIDSVGVDVPGIDSSWMDATDVIALTTLVEFMAYAINKNPRVFSGDRASFNDRAQVVYKFNQEALHERGLHGHRVFALIKQVGAALQEFVGLIRPSGAPSRSATHIQATAKCAEITEELVECQEERNDLQDEVRELKRQLVDVEKDKGNRAYAQGALEKHLTSVQEQLRNAQSLIARLEKENKELRRDLKELKDND